MVTTRSTKQASTPSKRNASHALAKATNDNLTTPSNSHDNQTRSEIIKKMTYLLSRLTSASSTICPSQIARGLNKDAPDRYPDWREMMDYTREVVWEQVKEGKVEVTQGGEVRPYDQRGNLKGPIRVRNAGGRG